MTTAKEVVQFFTNLAKSGKGVDKDGAYGFQCADVPTYTAKHWFGVDLWGNAADLLKSAKQAGWQTFHMPTEENPKAGDFFVMNAVFGGVNYGHTGIVIEDSDGFTMKTVEQNIDGNWDSLQVGGPSRFNTRNFKDVAGWFRPPYNQETKSNGAKNVNGEIYSPLITIARPEVFWSGGLRKQKIQYIVIHGTATTNVVGSYSTWLKSRNNQTSAHYLVTDNDVMGCVGENYVAWHSGGTAAITNENSIGVEHINSSIGNVNDPNTYLFSDKTIDNGARLVSDICKRYGLEPDSKTIVPHRSVSATACPQTLDMTAYIEKVKGYYYGKEQPKPKTNNLFAVKVSIDNLTIRNGAGLSAKRVQTIKQGIYTITETKNVDGLEWGKLKSGLGWIALKFTQRVVR